MDPQPHAKGYCCNKFTPISPAGLSSVGVKVILGREGQKTTIRKGNPMALRKPLNRDTIEAVHYKLWADAKAKHNTDYGWDVPREERAIMDEKVRALWALSHWDGTGSAIQHLRRWSLVFGTANWAVKNYCQKGDEKVAERRGRSRRDMYREFERWAVEHEAEQFTTAQLAEVSGFSTQTVLKYVTTSLYFSRVKRGLYEARNPHPKKKSNKSDGNVVSVRRKS